jgi:ubiquinone/menaquinone biosynthesis C-methylase UbiE
MKYREIDFWRKKKWPNARVPQSQLEKYSLKYLREFVGKAKTILDFGPGVGRMFPAFKDAHTVEGFDISGKWRNELARAAKHYKFKFNLTVSDKIGVLPYQDKSFDVAVAMAVFLHQRPAHIEKIMRELIRVSNKVIVGTYMHKGKDFSTVGTDKSKYNHDYIGICRLNGWKASPIKYGSTKSFIYFYYTER